MEESEHLQKIVFGLKDFLNRSLGATDEKKLSLLSQSAPVNQFLKKAPKLEHYLKEASNREKIVVYSTLYLGQGPNLFGAFSGTKEESEKIDHLIRHLSSVEQFYKGMGGLIGYHAKTLELIIEKLQIKQQTRGKTQYLRAPGLNLPRDRKLAEEATLQGILQLEKMAEVYPIGGAGDRLDLLSDEGHPLPAALLPFLGRTLLEGLIRDLQAREYLYYKLLHKQVTTPIALMTSYEKNNNSFIHSICEKHEWFGRGKDHFFLFVQPLVPVVTVDGFWRLKGHLEVVLKPGGHGVIWKLAKEEKVFEWLKGKKRKKALIRQINNPLAGLDEGLLAFTGWGCHKEKAFGFLSCERLVGSAEGVLVLIEECTDGSYSYKITNLEYTDFEKFGVQDQAEYYQSPYSQYPSNTNVLFADIDAIENTINEASVPGMLVNMKREPTFDPQRKTFQEISSGRLESTMQNIADHLIKQSREPLNREDLDDFLDTFIVYNERWKTISVTKRSYSPGKSFLETPEGAFFDLMQAHRRLLEQYCSFTLPPEQNVDDFLKNGPSILFLFHPALGPLFSIIAKKLKRGKFSKNAELQLEIAEVDIESLDLQGSLLVTASTPLGPIKESKLIYSEECGKLQLYNVKVKNAGRNAKQKLQAWKNEPLRKESLSIILNGNAEFYAKDVTFEGDMKIVVPDGIRMSAMNENGKITFKQEPISEATWHWRYLAGDDSLNERLILQRVERGCHLDL